MQDRGVFGKLFDIMEGNMTESGGRLEYSREAFLYCTQCIPGKADFLQMNLYSNPTFLQTAYVALFFRTADEGARKSWLGRSSMSREEFQKKLMDSLIRSGEFLDKGVALENYFYSQYSEVNRALIPAPAAGGQGAQGISNPALNRLYRFYRKLPKPVKSLIRKVVGLR